MCINWSEAVWEKLSICIVRAGRAKTSVKAKSAQSSQVSENDPGKTGHSAISVSVPVVSVTIDIVAESQETSDHEVFERILHPFGGENTRFASPGRRSRSPVGLVRGVVSRSVSPWDTGVTDDIALPRQYTSARSGTANSHHRQPRSSHISRRRSRSSLFSTSSLFDSSGRFKHSRHRHKRSRHRS